RVERNARLRALRAAEARVVVVLPIDEKQVVRGRLAVGAELAAFERPDLQRGDKAGDRLHQTELAAIRARRVVDLVARDVRANVAGAGLDHRALGGDRDFFAHTGERHGERERDFLADVEDQTGALERLKSLEL